VEDLVGRWREELARAGYPSVKLANAVEQAGPAYQPPGLEVLDDLAGQLLGPGGRLAQDKTFTRDDVVVAVAPHLHGLPVSFLDKAVESVFSPFCVSGWRAASEPRQTRPTAGRPAR
jgi:hypothetical protein